MARTPSPWFWKARDAWFVTIDGSRIKLAETKSEAQQRFHELMAISREERPTSDQVVPVIDAFLEWVEKNLSRSTYVWYLGFLQSFVESIPRGLRLRELKPWHVQQWADSNPNLSASTRRARIISVQRSMRWAEQQGFLNKSPLAHMKKPECGRRDQTISSDEFAALLSHFEGDCFCDVLIAAWDTGARPQELTSVESRHFDETRSRWVFPPKESKNRKRPRIIYMSERVEAIVRRRIADQGEGLIFRNSDSAPWTKDAIGCRFKRLAKTHGKQYCLYHFRHSFATRKMQEGLDPLTVAELLGHSDPSMLATVYQHLAHDPGHMLSKLRASGT